MLAPGLGTGLVLQGNSKVWPWPQEATDQDSHGGWLAGILRLCWEEASCMSHLVQHNASSSGQQDVLRKSTCAVEHTPGQVLLQQNGW